MHERKPLPDGMAAGIIKILSRIDDDALGYRYLVEVNGASGAKELAELTEFMPRDIAVRGEGHTMMAARPEVADILKQCLARFTTEAEALARTRHPALLPVSRVFQHLGTSFMLTPRVEGRTLATVANSLQRLPTQEEIDKVARPLVMGISALHALNLVHANIGPDTILVKPGIEPLLTRPGGARAFLAARTRTVHACVTPGYSAPELYIFDPASQGPACDVFSLAATLYRLVMGRAPADVIQRNIGEALPSATTSRGSYRPEMLQAIDAGLALDPRQRPRSMVEFGQRLAGQMRAAPVQPPQQPQALSTAAPRPLPAPVNPAVTAPPPPATKPAAAVPAKSQGAAVPAGSDQTIKPAPAAQQPRLVIVPRDTAKSASDAPPLQASTGRPPQSSSMAWLLADSKRPLVLGAILLTIMGTGMWLLDRQLRGPAKPAAEASRPAVIAAAPAPSNDAPAADAAKAAHEAAAAKREEAAKAAEAAQTQAMLDAELKETERKELEKRETERKETERRDAELKAAEQKSQAEAQRAAEESEQQRKSRLAAIGVGTDRDALLSLGAADAGLASAVAQRLSALGYARTTAGPREIWVRPGQGEAFRDCDTCPELVLVPPLAAAKGAPLAVGRYEVTRDEFATFVAETGYDASGGCYARKPEWQLDKDLSWRTPGFQQTGRDPVVCVSYLDAEAYVAWLSDKTKNTYRLPTEAEWSHAAYGGAASVLRYPFGNDADAVCAFGNGADLTAKESNPGWTTANCRDGFTHTAPAGSFKPNHFGLYDAIGNAWEWVDSCSVEKDGGPRIASGAQCPADAPRILKGGSWGDTAALLEPSARSGAAPNVRDEIAGFRVLRQAPAAATPANAPAPTAQK